MAQAIGGAVIGLLLYFCSLVPFVVLGKYMFSSGCLLLAGVFALSFDSMFAGLIALGIALYVLNAGIISVGVIAGLTGLWAFLRWGFK